MTLRLSNRTAVRLDTHLSLQEALQHLGAAQQQAVLASGGSSSHHSGGKGEAGSGGSNAAAPHVNGNSTVPEPSAAAAAGGQSGVVDVQAAACALFGRDLSRCLGIPRTCHRVCAVPDAAGMLAGLSFCLEPAAGAAASTAAAAGAASLSDVLSGMKASLLSHNFDRCACVCVFVNSEGRRVHRQAKHAGTGQAESHGNLWVWVCQVRGVSGAVLSAPRAALGRQCAGGHARHVWVLLLAVVALQAAFAGGAGAAGCQCCGSAA